MAKNILVFADGTGNEGGLLPDESPTNVYKLYRATRTGPESIIDPNKHGRLIQNGKPFRNFGGMLPREAVVNWLLCATANAIDGRQLTFVSTDDPIGGDGIIVDETTGEDFPTEHVMVPVQQSGADAEELILKAIDSKRNKGGASYASGKTLVVLLNIIDLRKHYRRPFTLRLSGSSAYNPSATTALTFTALPF